MLIKSLVDNHCAEAKMLREQLLSLIHISEPTRQEAISYAVFCLLLQKLDDVVVLLLPFLSLLLVDFHLLTRELKLLLQDCNLLG